MASSHDARAVYDQQSPQVTADHVAPPGEQQSFLPYPPIGERLEHVPVYVRPEVNYYQHRMGFLPYTIQLYLHVPWVAEYLFKLNNGVMRDERSALSEHFKYRLALLVSRDNECTYCTAHHAVTLQRRWDYSDTDLRDVLGMTEPTDEREAVAFEFAHQASLDAGGVTDELRQRLTSHFSPQEVMEIVLVVGFWKMYNTMHTAMGVPLEDPVAAAADWVHVPAQ